MVCGGMGPIAGARGGSGVAAEISCRKAAVVVALRYALHVVEDGLHLGIGPDAGAHPVPVTVSLLGDPLTPIHAAMFKDNAVMVGACVPELEAVTESANGHRSIRRWVGWVPVCWTGCRASSWKAAAHRKADPSTAARVDKERRSMDQPP